MRDDLIKLNVNKATQEAKPEKFKDLFLIDIEYSNNEAPTSYLFEDCFIFLCLEGDERFFINEKQYSIVPNTILIVPPNYLIRKTVGIYHFKAKGAFFPIDLVAKHFNGKGYNLTEMLQTISCFQVSEEKMNELLEFYYFLEKQYYKTVNAYSTLIISNLVFTFLVKVREIYSSINATANLENKPHKLSITEHFFDLVSSNYKYQRSLTFYADKMCLSPKHLSTTIKKTTGRPALVWINEYVILKAKYLIKTTDMSISEVSDYLNIPNQSFFSRLFKKYVGLTPKEYSKG